MKWIKLRNEERAKQGGKESGGIERGDAGMDEDERTAAGCKRIKQSLVPFSFTHKQWYCRIPSGANAVYMWVCVREKERGLCLSLHISQSKISTCNYEEVTCNHGNKIWKAKAESKGLGHQIAPGQVINTHLNGRNGPIREKKELI